MIGIRFNTKIKMEFITILEMIEINTIMKMEVGNSALFKIVNNAINFSLLWSVQSVIKTYYGTQFQINANPTQLVLELYKIVLKYLIVQYVCKPKKIIKVNMFVLNVLLILKEIKSSYSIMVNAFWRNRPSQINFIMIIF